MSAFETFDVRAYLDWMGVEYWEPGSKNVSRRAGFVGLQCIYCDDTSNHLGIELRGRYRRVRCWKCGSHGTAINFIMDLEGIAYAKAMGRIEAFQDPFLIGPEDEAQPAPALDLSRNPIPKRCLAEPFTQGQLAYLRSRRYDPRPLIEKWGLVSGGVFGDWKYRLIIPITLGGHTIHFTALDTTGEREPKYKHCPDDKAGYPIRNLLYGYDEAAGRKSVIVVEGVTDVWRMGFGTVAMFGMGVVQERISQLMATGAGTFYIMLDGGEVQAKRNAREVAAVITSLGRNVEVVELPKGDPDDLTDADADALRRELGMEEPR